MGVPKFFRFMSERYPCLCELVRENQIPEFDNLYLDMNGIIHNCSHPNDLDVHFRISEEQIFRDIFHYIDALFRIIQPQKLFFMAIDGVAPRAKMNQQRGRRFRSAKDAEVLEQKAISKGEILPTDARFDSNCITPGTPFMARLHEALQYFIKYKLSTNPLWQKCRIILSGHETPGEGEHKIIEYIRYLKSEPTFDPNTRHCLYGLDADLIMLGLCTHEQHFSLLREEVKFGKNAKRATSVDDTRFFLLHLGLLKEYLELEFAPIRNQLPFAYDIEKIVDDWIFMGFLVGNDFIPHLPNLHISSNALPLLYKAYMEVLPTMDGYINEEGILNLERLEIFMKKLAIVDLELFQESGADFKYFNAAQNTEAFDFDVSEITNAEANGELADFIKLSDAAAFGGDIDEDDDEEAILRKEFENHKRDYYINKLKYPEVTSEVIMEQTECYIRALQWTLAYYYRGVQSWSWYYPHHYAPFISDVQNFKNFKIDFDMEKPFLPFEQLLSVLPAASKQFLPRPLQNLMIDENSELIEYYPKDFETDLNGKKQDWEAVVLIPFIDEQKLLGAIKQLYAQLTPEEAKRNSHGPMFQYDYDGNDSKGNLAARYGLPELANIYCTDKPVDRQDVVIPKTMFVLKPLPNTLKNVYFPGFPTMKHLKYTSILAKSRVRVFEQPSRNDNMILKILFDKNHDVDLPDIVGQLLGKEVFVSWPHLGEARIVKISNDRRVWKVNGPPNGEEQDSGRFDSSVRSMTEHFMSRVGIDVGAVTSLVHVFPIIGREYIFGSEGRMTLTKSWGNIEAVYPLQMIVKDIAMHESKFVRYKQVEEVFTSGSQIFMLTTPYYGSKGSVVDPMLVKTCGRIKVNLMVYPEPNFDLAVHINEAQKGEYVNSYTAGTMCGITNNLFSRITGNILVIGGARRSHLPENTNKTNVGLQLKFNKSNEEVIGYTRKLNGNNWMYSPQVIKVVQDYVEKFPDLFQALSRRSASSNDVFFELDLFPTRAGQNYVEEIAKWVKEQPHYKSERRTCGDVMIEKETLVEVMKSVNEMKNHALKLALLQVKPHLLFKPDLQITTKAPDATANYRLFDRVIVARNNYIVPLASRGTVIGMHGMMDPNPIRQEHIKVVNTNYDILFDKEFDDGHSLYGLAEHRVYRVAETSLINISYGLSKNQKREIKIQQNAAPPKENSWDKPLEFRNKTIDSSASTASFVSNNASSNESSNNESNFQHIWEALKKNNVPMTIQIEKSEPKKQQQQQKPTTPQRGGGGGGGGDVNESEKEKTDMLKKLLGLKVNVPEPRDNITTGQENTDKMLKEMFQMHKTSQAPNQQLKANNPNITNLPQPPSNWMQEAFMTNLDQSRMVPNTGALGIHPNSYQSTKPAEIIQTAGNAPMIASPTTNNLYPFPRVGDGTNTTAMYYRPQALSYNSPEKNRRYESDNRNNVNTGDGGGRPKGPHKLSNNNSFPVGNGAFIPLQAARKAASKKQNNQRNNHSVPQQPVSEFVQRNTANRQAVQQAHEENRQNFANFICNEKVKTTGPANLVKVRSEEVTVTKTVTPKVPRSRIAAIFPVVPPN